MHTQCSENKQTVSCSVKEKFYCIMVSVHVYQVWAFLHLHFKRNKTKKAKMGYLDSIDLEHCKLLFLFLPLQVMSFSCMDFMHVILDFSCQGT